jgi:hypothetical protein
LTGPEPITNFSYGEQLAQKNYYPACLYGVPARRPGMMSTIPFWNLMEMKNQAQFNSLSHFAQMQLAGWIVPKGNAGSNALIPADGEPISCGDTFFTFLRHADKGSVPKNAVDIMDQIFFLDGPERAKARFELLMNGKPEEYPKFFLSLINPQTMRLYASFDGSVFEPGGLIFRKLKDVEEARQVLGKHGQDNLIREGFAEAWEIKIQGAKPGEILDTGYSISHHY